VANFQVSIPATQPVVLIVVGGCLMVAPGALLLKFGGKAAMEALAMVFAALLLITVAAGTGLNIAVNPKPPSDVQLITQIESIVLLFLVVLVLFLGAIVLVNRIRGARRRR
jgi:hypothetical protein